MKGKLMDKQVEREKVFTALQKSIIKSWELTKVVHPSYGEVAKMLGCSPNTVFRTIKIHLGLKKE